MGEVSKVMVKWLYDLTVSYFQSTSIFFASAAIFHLYPGYPSAHLGESVTAWEM